MTSTHHRQISTTLIALCVLLALTAILISATGAEEVAVLLSVMALVGVNVIVGSLLIGYRRYTRQRLLPGLIASVFSLALIISVAVTHWPLRVSYALSRDAFDAIAQRVRAGEPMPPRRVGLLKIRKAEVYNNGIVCLWTDLDFNGKTGFVQCGPDRVPFNLWSIVRLDTRWQFISED